MVNRPEETSTNTEAMLSAFASYIPYMRSLASLTPDQQLTPLGEGKWAVRDVVAHMWQWDVFFWEHAIRPIALGEPLSYRSIDFDAFNDRAKASCRELEWAFVTEEAARMRERLDEAVRGIPETEYEREYRDADGRPFSVAAYLADFFEHDEHHRRQIDRVI